MPSAITFWQLPEDEAEFFEYVKSTGNVLVAPNLGTEPGARPDFATLDEHLRLLSAEQIFFGPEPHLINAPLVESRPYTDMRGSRSAVRSFVDTRNACVMGYRRGALRDGRFLELSNLHYYDDFGFAGKDQGFVLWARRVFAWTRRRTFKFNGYRATSRVRDAVEHGSVELTSS